MVGNAPEDPYTRVVITNFNTLAIGTANIKWDFPWVKNPALASDADDELVTLNIYATNINSGLPGTMVGEHRAKYVNRIRTSARGLHATAGTGLSLALTGGGTGKADQTALTLTFGVPGG
jgi:hypothetical protein